MKDNNVNTHEWNELNANCQDVEIRRAAPAPGFGTHDFFKEVVFTDGAKETFRNGTMADNSKALLLSLKQR